MKERGIFLYIVSLIGLFLSLIQSDGGMLAWNTINTIIATLMAVVLVSVALLFNQLLKNIPARIAGICALAIVILAAGQAMLPMAAATAIACFGTTSLKVSLQTIYTGIVIIVSVILFMPGLPIIITTALLAGLSIYSLRLMERLEKTERRSEGNAVLAEEMREMLGSRRRMAKSTEQVSRLEERNRLAARIHDEIGHGMSGSILLLEGANLVMDNDPEKAHETIVKVTENLRESVEEIRKVLREERSASAEVSLARIENELLAFADKHPGIKTRLDQDGNMDEVSSAVWICVFENMLEALTNTLKHSQATLFLVSLKNSAGLLRVEFSDNGGKPDFSSVFVQDGKEIQQGIGLQNMEERAALCYGRCFFRHEEDGFHIVMTFPRKGEL